MDERFILHRYYSSRLALVVGAVMIAAWTLYEYYANSTARWDLVIISAVTALTKLGAFLYYQLTE